MNNQQWQVGKQYRLKPEMKDEFIQNAVVNAGIYNTVGDSIFTVASINVYGEVNGLAEYRKDVGFWFHAEEIKFFELVESSPETGKQSEQDIVTEWLDKLHYVMRNDYTVSDELQLYGGGLRFDTDLCSLYTLPEIYNFITTRYTQMKLQQEAKRKQELLDKRNKLELELAKIKLELGE